MWKFLNIIIKESSEGSDSRGALPSIQITLSHDEKQVRVTEVITFTDPFAKFLPDE